MTTRVRFVLSYDFLNGFYRIQSRHIFNENLHCCYGRRQRRYVFPQKVNTRVVLTLFYYMTLSTGKQRRHMIIHDSRYHKEK